MPAGQRLLATGALLGASGVTLGAFGAHALRNQLTAQAAQTWDTAVAYQLTHALAVVAVGVWMRLEAVSNHYRALSAAGWTLVVGIVLFSGSLYALALGGPRLLGPVTPLGGVAFIVGWSMLAWAALRPHAGD